MEKTPLVSVCCITYNHAPYISQCVDGFLMQKTSFPYEIIINDDCSSDGTMEILKEYADKYPDLIQLILHDENQYSKGIRSILATFVYPLVKGKYIALCEGDDYWTDPYKLQKQVDYMEAHPECGLVWAKARKFYQEAGVFKGTAGSNTENYYDMFIHYGVSPLTCMYRKSAIEGYDEFVKGQKWLLGDSPLFLYIAHDNDIHFMDEIVGVYRILKSSASHHTSFEKNLAFQNSTFDVVKFYCEKYGHPNFKQLETIHYSRVFNYAFNYGKYDVARELYEQIPYPNLKIKFKRFILPSRILRSIYQFLYHKLVN